MIEVSPRNAARAAWICAALNLAAAGAMIFLLQPGLPVPGSEAASRIEYLRSSKNLWWEGWLLWHAAAIGLLAFYVGLAGQFSRSAPLLATLALLCAAAGLAADLAAETAYMGFAPGLGAEAFSKTEIMNGLLTGYLGNGLYSLAGLFLSIAGAKELPRGLFLLSLPVWAAGFWLSAATLAHSAAGQFWSTAILMPLFVLWTALVARWLGRRSS